MRQFRPIHGASISGSASLLRTRQFRDLSSMRLFRGRLAQPCVNSGICRPEHASIPEPVDPGMRLFRGRLAQPCVNSGICQPEHASIPEPVNLSMRLFRNRSTRAMHLFRLRIDLAVVACPADGDASFHTVTVATAVNAEKPERRIQRRAGVLDSGCATDVGLRQPQRARPPGSAVWRAGGSRSWVRRSPRVFGHAAHLHVDRGPERCPCD